MSSMQFMKFGIGLHILLSLIILSNSSIIQEKPLDLINFDFKTDLSSTETTSLF